MSIRIKVVNYLRSWLLPPAGKKMEHWVNFGTSIYGVGLLLVIVFRFHEILCLDINELGDFLAGAFGPVAFIWLVMGFKQQSHELSLNLEQQKIMAKAATDQIENTKNELKIREKELSQTLSPRFQFYEDENFPLYSSLDRSIVSKQLLTNRGREATGLIATFDPPIGGTARWDLSFIAESGLAGNIDFVYGIPYQDIHGVCVIQYIRMDARVCEERFKFQILAAKPVPIFTKAPSSEL